MSVVFSGRGYSINKINGRINLYIIAKEPKKQRLYESLGTSQLTEAKRKAKRVYESYRDSRVHHIAKKTLSDHWEDCFNLREGMVEIGDLTTNTQVRAATAWKNLDWYWGTKMPYEINQVEFQHYMNKMEKRAPGRGLKNEKKYLQVLINYLYQLGVNKNKITLSLGRTKARAKKSVRHNLNDRIVRSLIEGAESSDARTHLLVFCGLFHGMRIEEVTKLEPENYYMKQGVPYLHIAKSKTGPRTIRVVEEVVPAIERNLEISIGKWFFSQVRNPEKSEATQINDKRFQSLKKRVGVSCVFHELRHTAISRRLIAGVNPFKVSRYFGVSLDEIDKTYAHLSEVDTEDCATNVGITI